MILSAPFRDSNTRLPLVGGIMAAGLLLLLAALFRVQVVHGALYGEREQAQSLRRIRIPPARGEIHDSHGVILANNRPSYDVVIYLDQLRRTKRQDLYPLVVSNLALLAQTVDRPVTITEREVRAHYQTRRPLPLVVWRDLSPPLVAAVAERANQLPALSLVAQPVRQYPWGALASHLLGYVRRAEPTPEEVDDDFFYTLPEQTGATGVERVADELLRGRPGARVIRVNPSGQTISDAAYEPPERGSHVVLTIDARIQQLVEQALDTAPLPAGKELRGAAVVLDPRTGAVLALASRPAYDPQLFLPGASADALRATLNNEAAPLLNRATGARYAPGSTFKPVTMLAAFESGAAGPDDTVECTGSFTVGNRAFGCWNRRGHGRVDAATAMRVSCDVWFYQHGLATKPERIAEWARFFGLGQPTGFDIGNETRGLVPTPQWKREQRGERWWDGDTAQLAMGQSFLLTTPLQMAVVAATLANGGTVWRPFVLERVVNPAGVTTHVTHPEARQRLRVNPAHMEFVRQAMLASVLAPDGTGQRAAVRGVAVAGKTGTAEADITEAGATRRIKRVWFIGFAPYDAPAVAFAVMFEDADSGGHTAAPVAGKILAGIFQKELARGDRGGFSAD